MRIIAGQWRGRKLTAPPGDTTRPTSDRAREALFSMLTSRVGSFEGLRIADIFAGTGALGLEALSRGAAHCTFVEQNHAVVSTLKANIAQFGANANVRAQSATSLATATEPYDLIFLDPPYHSGVIPDTLSQLSAKAWVSPSSWLSVETAGDESFDAQGFTVESERKIGKARIILLRQAA